MWFQFKEIAEQSDGKEDAKESFTEMNEDWQMQDEIWVQMVQCYAIVMQKPLQKGTT